MTVAALLSAVGSAQARVDIVAPGEGGTVQLRTGSIRTTPGTNVLVNGAGLAENGRYLVQLDGPLTAERSAAIAEAGLTLGDYISDNTWIVKLDHKSVATIRTIPFVAWIGAFDNAWKIDPELAARPYSTPERQSLAANGLCKVVVATFDHEAPDEAMGFMMKSGAQVLGASPCGPRWLIDAVLTPAAARSLAALPTVQFIEDSPEGTLRNDSNRWVLQSNVNAQTPIWNRGIHGEGQIGGLIDDTPRESHCMFDDAVAPGSPAHRKFIGWRNVTGAGFHGTHTAGTFAGDNAPFGVYTQHDGLAFAARISFSGLDDVWNNPSTLIQRLNDQHADGARVHSNSWGNDNTTAYTTWCVQIDQFTWLNEDSVVAFAVTNLGSLKTPENSINCLAVGASNDSPSQGNVCSGGAGPTADGRRKPEIFAPGCNTQSASSSSTCSVTNATGTSMACPAIAGAGLLVRQYFTDGFYPTGAAVPTDGFIPSAALIRAVLINGAVDMTGPSGYPNNSEGWGRLVLDNALFFAGDARELRIGDVRNAQGMTTGQLAEHQIVCDSSGQPLKITLAWTGPAGSANSSNPVVNNLDLEVVAPGGSVYFGNVFTLGQSSTGGSRDLKNNIEQFLLSAPAPGTYTVRVRATTVNNGPQGYSLAITGDISDPCTAPVIDAQPGSTTVDEGQLAQFSVAASGPGLTYQWRRNGDSVPSGGRISGSTGPTLIINPVNALDAGTYDVIVTAGCGLATPTAPATLTVNATNPCPPDIDGLAGLGVPDLFTFLSMWFANDPIADWDTSGAIEVTDIFAYLSDWFAAC